MRRLLMTTFFVWTASMAAAQDLSDDRVKELALQAILENPEIIMEAVAILEQRERERQSMAAAGIALGLADDPSSPVFGNPEGDVTIVEFFDYNCGYCRRAGPALQGVLDTDKGVKVVMREWPVLGEASVFAARAALAARMQGKYEEFHWGLMNGGGRATEATVMRLARDLDLDTDQLRSDMDSDAVNQHLAQSAELARSLGFTGTPAFIVGERVNPGYLDQSELEQLIAAAREG